MDPLPRATEIEAGERICSRRLAFLDCRGPQHAQQVPARVLHRDQVLGVQLRTQLQEARDCLPTPTPPVRQRRRAGPQQNSKQRGKRRYPAHP